MKEKYGDNIPQELRDEFRAASKPLMKYTNILTFNTRAIALYISLLLGEPWLYFVFEVVVMTSLFVYMRPVSYTHLDVYKRQVSILSGFMPFLMWIWKG